MIDFRVVGEQFTFTPKEIMIDYILFDCKIACNLDLYYVFEEGAISITSDHLPSLVSFSLKAKLHYLENFHCKLAAWHKARPEAIDNYKQPTEQELHKILNNHLHTKENIENFYQTIVRILTICANSFIPKSQMNPFTKPGWTKNEKELHAIARSLRRIWVSEGKPRGMGFQSYRHYKRAKRNFRNAQNLEYEIYLKSVHGDLDEAAEMDIRLFWRLVKQRRPRPLRIYPEICDASGTTHNDPDGVANAFAEFYEEIYRPLEDDHFDNRFKHVIESHYTRIKTSVSESSSENDITQNDVISAISSLKMRKAPGIDGVTDEHIAFASDLITKCLCKLYNAIMTSGTVASTWKQGFIVPIYKGGDKPKHSCNSYRPVALLPCIYKLFEKILSNRISTIEITKTFPNIQQQGFQKQLGCITASFNLHETMNHNLEQGSNIYISFLDTSKAFDTVWRQGLMYKLHNLGIKGKLYMADYR